MINGWLKAHNEIISWLTSNTTYFVNKHCLFHDVSSAYSCKKKLLLLSGHKLCMHWFKGEKTFMNKIQSNIHFLCTVNTFIASTIWPDNISALDDKANTRVKLIITWSLLKLFFLNIVVDSPLFKPWTFHFLKTYLSN